MFTKNAVLKTALVAALTAATLFCYAGGAQAQGPNRDLGMNCWNNQFYKGTSGFFDSQLSGTTNSFWQEANMIELEEDAAQQDGSYNGEVGAEIYAFSQKYGTNWLGDSYNDDVCWAVLAFQRGGQQGTAQTNFDNMWNRAYDTNLIQGLWWTTARTSKNACVNGPGCIAAARLGEGSRASQLWSGFLSNSRVCDLSKYRIADHINSNGSVDWTELSYNQGSLMGAAEATGNGNAASMALNESINAFGTPMRPEGFGDQDMAGGRGIFARYAMEVGGSANYLTTNANDAWNSRNSQGITYGYWTSRSGDGGGHAWDSSAAAAMEVDW